MGYLQGARKRAEVHEVEGTLIECTLNLQSWIYNEWEGKLRVIQKESVKKIKNINVKSLKAVSS